jgi:hypothetical protein
MIDRRRSPRRPAAEVHWTSARLRPGRDVALVNIGNGGALVEGASRLLPGTEVVLQLFAPQGSVALWSHVVRCEVTSLDPSRGIRYQGALCFRERQRLVSEE